MKLKIIIICLGVVLIPMVVGYVLSHHPAFWKFVFVRSMAAHSPVIKVKEVLIETVRWEGIDRVTFENISLKLKIKGSSYFVSMGSVQINGLRSMAGIRPRLNILVGRSAVVSDLINVSDLTVKGDLLFKGWQFDRAQGHVVTELIHVNRYEFTGFDALCDGGLTQVYCRAVQSIFYNGRLKGQMSVDLNAPFMYQMSVDYQGVDLGLLASINPGVFDNIKGIVEGVVRISGNSTGVRMIKANLNAPLGGEISASVLGYLSSYIPQRKQIEELIKHHAKIPLEIATATIDSLGAEAFQAHIRLTSSELNLDMNVNIDINIDGGLSDVFKYFNR